MMCSVLSDSASTACSSGLEPHSSPTPNAFPYSTISSTTWRCWFTLIGYTVVYPPPYSNSLIAARKRWLSCSMREELRWGCTAFVPGARAVADERPWLAKLLRLAGSVEDGVDLVRSEVRNRLVGPRRLRVAAYRTYGTTRRLHVMGRVLRDAA